MVHDIFDSRDTSILGTLIMRLTWSFTAYPNDRRPTIRQCLFAKTYRAQIRGILVSGTRDLRHAIVAWGESLGYFSMEYYIPPDKAAPGGMATAFPWHKIPDTLFSTWLASTMDDTLCLGRSMLQLPMPIQNQ
jgi:hypothetical protein